MDWIDFKKQKPNDGDHIWGLLPSGKDLEGYFSNLKHGKEEDYYMFHHGSYYKIVKWATWDVIY